VRNHGWRCHVSKPAPKRYSFADGASAGVAGIVKTISIEGILRTSDISCESTEHNIKFRVAAYADDCRCDHRSTHLRHDRGLWRELPTQTSASTLTTPRFGSSSSSAPSLRSDRPWYLLVSVPSRPPHDQASAIESGATSTAIQAGLNCLGVRTSKSRKPYTRLLCTAMLGQIMPRTWGLARAKKRSYRMGARISESLKT
jgi:hypothetical protein